MASISTGTFSRALEPGVRKWVGDGYNEKPLQHLEIFEKKSSNKAIETEAVTAGTGLAVAKSEGSSIEYDDQAQAYAKRYQHVVYGLGYTITREAIEDNLYAELAKTQSRALGKSLRETKEIIAANILNRAFNSSYTGGDGKELCATDHPLNKGGTFQNELTTAADLSEASIEQACIDIRNQYKNEAGLRIHAMPKKLIVPSALCFEAERILKSTLQNDTANNALNAVRSKGVLPGGYTVNDYLTDTDAFFILTDVSNGLTMFQRRGLELKNDTDFDTENVKYKATERYSFGWTDPRGIFGSPGAA